MQELSRVALFAGMSNGALADLAGIARPFAVAPGEALFRQGDAPSGLFVLDEGALEIAARLPGDEDAQVSLIAAGEIVGEFAMLDPGPRSATVTAIAPSTGLFLPARSFLAMLGDGRAGAVEAINLLRELVAGRTRQTLERLANEPAAAPCELRGVPHRAAETPSAGSPELVRSLSRFAEFDADETAELLTAGEFFMCARGSLLIPAGAQPGQLLLVVRGAVRGALDRGDRQEQVMIHGPGEWAGLISAFDECPQPLLLSAAEDAVVLRVASTRFASWRTNPGVVGQAVLDGVDRQLVRDQRRANRHLARALATARFNAMGRMD